MDLLGSWAWGTAALFLDFGGMLARLRDHRTVVDAEGNPVLMPNVPETLARVRPAYEACFIVSNQGRIGRGEIPEAEVLRRFAWLNDRLGRAFTDWRLCPHVDADGCACRKPRPGMFPGHRRPARRGARPVHARRRLRQRPRRRHRRRPRPLHSRPRLLRLPTP
jgi:hypothetical protein